MSPTCQKHSCSQHKLWLRTTYWIFRKSTRVKAVCHNFWKLCLILTAFFSFSEYYGVVTIPVGARSIRVMELNTSSSYLAVRDTQRRYYLNGHWTVDWPGRHPIAGAIFEYKRPYNRPESLISSGPTNETLVIEARSSYLFHCNLCSYFLLLFSLSCATLFVKNHKLGHTFLPPGVTAGLEPGCTLGIHSEESWWEEETQLHMGHHTLPVLSNLCRR